jgi:putative salt-induced outer membrane protein YdiY
MTRWLVNLGVGAWLLAATTGLRADEAAGPMAIAPPSLNEPLPLPPPNEPLGDAFESLLPPLVEPDQEAAFAAPPNAWFYPAYWWGSEPWDAGLELGINGSEGNKSTLSLRSGGHVKRVTPRWKFDSSLVYNKNRSNDLETQHNAKVDARVDRILNESPWTLFSLDNLIYDEFQTYDLQVSVNAGVGYQLLKTHTIDLLARVGTGATREFGGVVEDWQPQALFGTDYTHQISTTQRLAAKIDYFPEWQDFREYRVVSDLGWQIALDRPKNVSLKLSLIDRYDSTPDGAKPNSFDYAVLLIWGL